MDRLVFPTATRNFWQTPFWLAFHFGLFAAEKLDVVFEFSDKGTDEPAKMLRSGNGKIAVTGMEQVILDRESGGHLITIAGNLTQLPFSLIAQPAIKKIGDLRGKTIGVSSLNTGTSAIIPKFLELHGLGSGDYKLLKVGPIETRWKLLRSGEIDAGLQGAPLDLIAIDAGFTNLGSPSEAFPEFQFTSITADERWARDNRDIVIRFLRAMLRGIEMFYTDQEKVAVVVMREAEITKDYSDRTRDSYIASGILPRDGEPSIAGIQALIDTSASVRKVSGRIGARPEDYVELSYLREARRGLT